MEMTSPVYTTGGQQSGSGSGGASTTMEMTSPVLTTAGSSGTPRMGFPIEARFGSDPEALPTPNNAR